MRPASRTATVIQTLRRLLVAVVGLSVMSLVAANAYRFYVRNQSERAFPPPGAMIELETHRAHVHCTGAGDPTVLLSAGHPAFSVAWALVRDPVAEFARVCAYDRAGLGWSTPRSTPADLRGLVADLEELVQSAFADDRLVLVGHSFGGLIARLYAQDHPSRLSGLVLVDALPGDVAAIAPAVRSSYASQIEMMRWAQRLGIDAVVARVLADPADLDQVPARIKRAVLHPGFGSRQLDGIIDEAQVLLADSFDVQARVERSLDDLPLIVIAFGRNDAIAELFPQLEDVDQERVKQWWEAAQHRLSLLSSRGRLVVAESSRHDIPRTEPGVVVEAVRAVVERARRPDART